MNPDFSNIFSSPRASNKIYSESQIQSSNMFHNNLFSSPIRFNNNDSLQSHSQEIQQVQIYNDLYNYATTILRAWGFVIGNLNYSYQNSKTLNCLTQLIRIRQKDIEYKSKIQEEISKMNFEANCTKSALNRTQSELESCKKMLGSLQNKSKSQQIKYKRELEKISNQKIQLVQIKQKLEQKNNQILHQIKKKDLQINKIKDTMKKPTEKGPIKNTFQITNTLNSKSDKNQEIYLNSLIKQKYQNQRKEFIQQNRILRQQLQQFSKTTINFIQWLKLTFNINNDFKEKNVYYNHNMIFKSNSVVDQFKQNLEMIKKSLITLPQDIEKGNKQNFQSAATNKKIATTNQIFSQKSLSPNLKKHLSSQNFINLQQKAQQSTSNKFKRKDTKPKQSTTPPKIQEIKYGQNKFNQISIISHISIKDLQTPKTKTDRQKWDILWDE